MKEKVAVRHEKIAAKQISDMVGKTYNLQVVPWSRAEASHQQAWIPVTVVEAYMEVGQLYINCQPVQGEGELIINNPFLLREIES